MGPFATVKVALGAVPGTFAGIAFCAVASDTVHTDPLMLANAGVVSRRHNATIRYRVFFIYKSPQVCSPRDLGGVIRLSCGPRDVGGVARPPDAREACCFPKWA